MYFWLCLGFQNSDILRSQKWGPTKTKNQGTETRHELCVSDFCPPIFVHVLAPVLGYFYDPNRVPAPECKPMTRLTKCWVNDWIRLQLVQTKKEHEQRRYVDDFFNNLCPCESEKTDWKKCSLSAWCGSAPSSFTVSKAYATVGKALRLQMSLCCVKANTSTVPFLGCLFLGSRVISR